MKKSLRNYRLFFHRMGLLLFIYPLDLLILSIVLLTEGFLKKKTAYFLPCLI